MTAGYDTTRPIATRFADNDVFGHVNNAVYYAYFDTAINGWIHDLTETASRDLSALGVVATSRCDFHAEVHFPQQLYVGISVTRLGTKSITYDLGLWADGDSGGELRASAHWVHVYVDPRTRNTVAVPVELRSALDRLGIPHLDRRSGVQ